MDGPSDGRGQRCCEAKRERKRQNVRAKRERGGGVGGGGGRGWVAGSLGFSPRRHADLNAGLAPGARH